MKRVIIIGATSGIGCELAKIYANNGWCVGVTGRRKANLEKLKETNPEKYWISSFDCTTENNADKLTELSNQMGGLDQLIVSSGTGDLNESLDYEIENRTNQLNVVAFTEIVGWAFNCFADQGKGQLAAISSVGGIRGSGEAPAYNASKAYQINYLEGLRQKAQKMGKPIFVTDIRPGFVDTAMAKGDGQFWVADKVKAASQMVKIIEKRKAIGYVTKRWKLIGIILSIIPHWIYKRM